MYTLHFMIVLINKISGSERDLIWFKKARDFIPFATLWFVSLHFPQRLFHNTRQQHLHTGVSTLDRLSLSCAAVILVHKSPLCNCAMVAALWSCLSCKHSNPAYASTWISIRLRILLAKYMLALNTFLMIWYSNAKPMDINRDCS